MSFIEYHQSVLASIPSQNPDINAATATIQEYTELCKSGQISREEYVALVQDVQSKLNIQQNMAELETMEKLNTAINGLISIAKIA